MASWTLSKLIEVKMDNVFFAVKIALSKPADMFFKFVLALAFMYVLSKDWTRIVIVSAFVTIASNTANEWFKLR